jgi:ribosomal protein S18 acetylase RimI-like enzyme
VRSRSRFDLLAQAARTLRREGLLRTAKRAHRSIRMYGLRATLGRSSELTHSHSWFRLDLSNGFVERPLPDGLELRRGGEDQLPWFGQLAARDNMLVAESWVEAGGECWVLLSGQRTAFTCWSFPRRVPMGAADGGWLKLPPGTVALQHSRVAPEFRGREIGPAAWSAIAGALAGEGVRTLVVRVDDRKDGAQRAFTKVGFARAGQDEPVIRELERQLKR